MGYDSFDGGSHDPHRWVPVGQISVPQWDDSKAGPTDSGNYVLPVRLRDKFYIIRACSMCPEVWWQEYDPNKAVD